ncbi:right-handed parallel beta-helix repeat-containing protein [Alienimonas californiensis]|uniref:right-handed parallel beta-helix repeat-containing protein n=1 Tax=Alienimonas californiensis TaxID=2527989 RepID=UPI0011A1B122|nr:right-handed parallel beta-helix repeat-containing protein [Alienimonas californiensis]
MALWAAGEGDGEFTVLELGEDFARVARDDGAEPLVLRPAPPDSRPPAASGVPSRAPGVVPGRWAALRPSSAEPSRRPRINRATLAAEGARLSVSACDAATVEDCVTTNCRGDGYYALGGDAVFRNCSAASVGGAGFRLIDGGAVDPEDCTVEGFAAESGAAGFSLVRCGDAALNRCAAAFGLGDGLSLHDGGTGPYPDGAFRATVTNLLAREVPCGVRVGAACTATLRHLTTDADGTGLHVAGGAAAAINSLFVGGTHGVRRDAGTLALDHVLLHGPTPAAGALPGPNDLLADPGFRDAAGDLRLVVGSPAINAGRDLGGTVDDDLTGAPRPSFGRCKLGAY